MTTRRMAGKIISMGLVLVLCMGFLPVVGARAEDERVVTFTTDSLDGTLTQEEVKAQLEAAEVGINDPFSAEMDGSVQAIGQGAFYFGRGLTSIIIGDNVASIQNAPFSDCANLESIAVSPRNSTYLSCNGVLFTMDRETIVLYPTGRSGTYIIPESVRHIDRGAFYRCRGLTGITITNNVMDIDDVAFVYCSGLESVIIPDSVTSIGGNAFSNCTGLTSVTIGERVESIGDYAFMDCTSLTSVYIPTSVTYIGWRNPFARCRSLTDINVSPKNRAFSSQDGIVFNKKKTTLVIYPAGKSGCYTIPDSVTSIADMAFYTCTGLTSVTVPDSVESIGGYAFDGCIDLTHVNLGNNVVNIYLSAFYGCTSLMSVLIPDSVISIGRSAFGGCAQLTSVILGNNVTSIGSTAFKGCAQLNSVVIGNKVTHIESEAFSGCAALADIIIPDSVTNLGYLVFAGTQIQKLTLPTSVKIFSRTNPKSPNKL